MSVGELALPLVCYVAVFPILAPCHLGQVGELALGHEKKRASLAPDLVQYSGEKAQYCAWAA